MTKSSKLYVGMDTHKDSTAITLAEDVCRQDVRYYFSISGDLASLDRAVRKLQPTRKARHFGHETGQCGYATHSSESKQANRCARVMRSS
jgi:hypothetical protein